MIVLFTEVWIAQYFVLPLQQGGHSLHWHCRGRAIPHMQPSLGAFSCSKSAEHRYCPLVPALTHSLSTAPSIDVGQIALWRAAALNSSTVQPAEQGTFLVFFCLCHGNAIIQSFLQLNARRSRGELVSARSLWRRRRWPDRYDSVCHVER